MKMKNKRNIWITSFILLGMLLISTDSCRKDNKSYVPEITTNPVLIISQTTASCGGNIINEGSATVTDRGVCWSTNQSPTIADSKTADGTGSGSFTSSITGLTANTTYYVRAFATNLVGTAYGNERIFTVVGLPTVTTSNFFNVKGSSAEAGGIVTNDGGGFVTNMGLCWNTNPNPTIANSFTTQFNLPMTGLTTNTVYYFRAYATNEAGTAYGNQISFNSGYLMGSTCGGGLVFYNDGNAHGLVCAAIDQIIKFAKWGCQGTIIGGTSTSINSGASNTNAIVANCSAANIAARVCNDLILNSYTDWYLPSIDELNLMYLNLHTQGMGGFPEFSTDYNPDYWSSSEYDKDYAWGYDFLGGNAAKDYKESSGFFFNVRAVRSF